MSFRDCSIKDHTVSELKKKNPIWSRISNERKLPQKIRKFSFAFFRENDLIEKMQKTMRNFAKILFAQFAQIDCSCETHSCNNYLLKKLVQFTALRTRHFTIITHFSSVFFWPFSEKQIKAKFREKKPKSRPSKSRVETSIYTLLVCLSVRLYPINVKTTETY